MWDVELWVGRVVSSRGPISAWSVCSLHLSSQDSRPAGETWRAL